MNVTEKNNGNSKPLIISDGCCIQYGDSLALDDVTFSINEGKKVARARGHRERAGWVRPASRRLVERARRELESARGSAARSRASRSRASIDQPQGSKWQAQGS